MYFIENWSSYDYFESKVSFKSNLKMFSFQGHVFNLIRKMIPNYSGTENLLKRILPVFQLSNFLSTRLILNFIWKFPVF